MKNLDSFANGVEKMNADEMSNIKGGSDFLDGSTDAWNGKPAEEGRGFWYYVGFYGQVMAGGYDHGSDLKRGQIGG